MRALIIAAMLTAAPSISLAQTAGEPGASAHTMATGDQAGQANGEGAMSGTTPGVPAAGAAAETSGAAGTMPAAKTSHHKHKQTDAQDSSATPK